MRQKTSEHKSHEGILSKQLVKQQEKEDRGNQATGEALFSPPSAEYIAAGRPVQSGSSASTGEAGEGSSRRDKAGGAEVRDPQCTAATDEMQGSKEKGGAPMRLVAPDGGWGWAVLFAAVMVNVLIPGTVKSFGVLFIEFMRVFDASPSVASWIPALCYFLYSSLGPLASILSMRYSYKTVTLVGGSFAAGGMMLSYLANSVTYLYFSYGVMVGVGVGLTFPVTIYIVSEYFDRRRGLATGLCISGSCIGTMIIPPLMQYLLNNFGHKIAVLVIGAALLNTLGCAMLYHPVEKHMKFVVDADIQQLPSSAPSKIASDKELGELGAVSHRSSIVSVVGSVTLDPLRNPRLSLSRRLANKQAQAAIENTNNNSISNNNENGNGNDSNENSDYPEEKPRQFDLAILKDPLYLVILISNSTSAISNTNFMILLPMYAIAEGYDKEAAALLLSIVSLLDLIGRIGGAALSDINLVPKHYYFVGGLGLSGVALALLPILGTTYVYLAIFCALFGLASGLYIGTIAVVLADMLGPERLASSYGISLFVNGLMQLFWPPLCNYAYEQIGSFKPIFLTLGMILVCGTALWSILPFIKRKNHKGDEPASKSPT